MNFCQMHDLKLTKHTNKNPNKLLILSLNLEIKQKMNKD